MTKPLLKGAIIGAGYFAQFQAEAWRRIPEIKIVALADSLAERAEAFARQWQIARAYTELEQMLQHECPDFVDIVTRPEAHLSLTQICAQANAQVICQKPMAPTWEECCAMVSACSAANVRLFIHENWRWQPWYREIKQLIEADTFGQVFHLGFTLRNGDGRGNEPYAVQPYFKEMPRLLLWETGVHFLDTFRYLAGDITSLACQTQRINPFIAGEDYALVQLTFANGVRGLLDANRISGPRVPAVAFGSMVLEGERGTLQMSPAGDLSVTLHDEPAKPHLYDKPATGYKGDSVLAFQKHLVDCWLNDTPCESEGEPYLHTVRATLACYEAAQTNRVIQLSEFLKDETLK